MLFCLLGRMRSGTTVLRNLIGSSPEIADLKEVFYGDLRKPDNYWRFMSDKSKVDPAAILPENRAAIWSEFIAAEREMKGKAHLIFDLKIDGFSSVMSSNGIDNYLFPLEGVDRLIYLERRNIAASLISKRISAISKRWHKFSDHAVLTENERLQLDGARGKYVPEPDRIHIDPHVLLSEVMWVERQNRIVVDSLAGRITLRVVYEDMLDAEGQFRRSLVQDLADATSTQVETFDTRPKYVKLNTRIVRDRLQNADEVVACFSSTPYLWMLTAT